MATWDDVARLALGLPEAVERAGRHRQWRVKDKSVAWERPLRPADIKALGDAAPDGPILAVHVADLGIKEALLAEDPEIYFTTPHFDGYRAILVRLEEIPAPELEELIIEAWLDRAPKRIAEAYLEANKLD